MAPDRAVTNHAYIHRLSLEEQRLRSSLLMPNNRSCSIMSHDGEQYKGVFSGKLLSPPEYPEDALCHRSACFDGPPDGLLGL